MSSADYAQLLKTLCLAWKISNLVTPLLRVELE